MLSLWGRERKREKSQFDIRENCLRGKHISSLRRQRVYVRTFVSMDRRTDQATASPAHGWIRVGQLDRPTLTLKKLYPTDPFSENVFLSS